MNWQVALRLGRVSNLPTVWTNAAAGVILAGGNIELLPFSLLLLAFSLFYVAGMFFNDAFDREYDARHRPERPIPAGAIRAQTVFVLGWVLLLGGEGLLVVLGFGLAPGQGLAPVLSGLVLATTILYYNAHHKDTPYSPVVIGICRVLVYITSALAVSPYIPEAVLWGSLALLAYVIGLAYAARQENFAQFQNLWPLGCLGIPFLYTAPGMLNDVLAAGIYLAFFVWVIFGVSYFVGRRHLNIPQGVVILIAGTSFLDGLLILNHGEDWGAVCAIGGVTLTRLFQRVIPGT